MLLLLMPAIQFQLNRNNFRRLFNKADEMGYQSEGILSKYLTIWALENASDEDIERTRLQYIRQNSAAHRREVENEGLPRIAPR